MITTCDCQNCNRTIEFDTNDVQFSDTATCPHCGQETRLALPQVALPPPPGIPVNRASADKVPWPLIVAGLILAAVVGFLIVFSIKESHSAALFGAGTVGGTAAITIVSLIIGLMWVFLPVFLVLSMNRMNRTLEKIEQNTRR